MTILDKVLNPNRGVPEISLVKPHSKKSREVREEDLPRVKEIAQQMVILAGAILMKKLMDEIYAMAHPQVDSKDPLRFFTFCPQSRKVREHIAEIDRSFVIVNPRIIRHTKTEINKIEGCLTFLGMKDIEVPRYNKIEVEYQQISRNKITNVLTLNPPVHKTFTGIISEIFQHEIDHFDCIYTQKDWKNLARTYYKI